ncbi:MAG TPA: glycosyltransferase family 2 protein [Thermoanaerobaculia bacterium]|nr:glycosyltransferase family 2 protein [Thermoanaerobaculia bacterium]
MLDLITPLVLTGNEEPNIARTLGQLRWAHEVIVVDSFSDDRTVEIARSFPNVRLLQRRFEGPADQWTYGLSEVATPWLLALDADYFVPDEMIRELDALAPPDGTNAYKAGFIYAVRGRPLRASLYPPRAVLLRRGWCFFDQDGHTQRERIEGAIGELRSRIVHDDRKSLSSFLHRQARYMEREAEKLATAAPGTLPFSGRIRRLRVIAPPLVFFYTLFVKRCILDGSPGWQYVFERTTAEMILSIALIERDLRIRS